MRLRSRNGYGNCEGLAGTLNELANRGSSKSAGASDPLRLTSDYRNRHIVQSHAFFVIHGLSVFIDHATKREVSRPLPALPNFKELERALGLKVGDEQVFHLVVE